MSHPHVAIASLGGTISMTPDAGAGGITPRLSAEQLAASAPGLAEVADIRTESLFQLPSASLGFGHLLAALEWADREVKAGAAGVVLTQGTDSIEETSFFLDLYWPHDEPLIVTGAMRAPQSAGADGPANLLDAARAAASASSRGRGVLVVMNDQVHSARWVRKRHSLAVHAFESPEAGPIGAVVEGQVLYFHPAATRPRPLPVPAANPVAARPTDTSQADGARLPRVALLETHIDDDGALAEMACAAGYDGLVIAGMGAGHLPFAFAERIGDLCKAIPMVVASRTGAGPTTSATYGYVGSEIDLARRGAIMAGWLCPRKARILLWALLADGQNNSDIATAWNRSRAFA